MVQKRRLRSASAKAREAATKELGTLTSRKVHKDHQGYEDEEEQQEVLATVPFPPGVEPAYVQVAAGGTYNLGNFESMRLDVSVTLPCLPSDIEETYERASDFVSVKLGEEENLWLGRGKSKKQ